jgi:hypothetical protein
MLKMVTFTIGMEKDANGLNIEPAMQDWNKQCTMRYLSDLFGGVTVIESEGAWLNSKFELVTEKGITVKTAIDTRTKSLADVMAIADSINAWHMQESIMIEFDGSVHFS